MKELLFKLRKGQILFQNCTIMPNYIAFLQQKKNTSENLYLLPYFWLLALLKKN